MRQVLGNFGIYTTNVSFHASLTFEADGQEYSESPGAFFLASKCVEPNKWQHVSSNPMKYL